MVYYKYIELANLEIIQKKTLEHILPIANNGSNFLFLDKDKYLPKVPELQESFNALGFKIKTIALYITFADGPIHIDYATETLPSCRINIPLQNCKGSRTEFFSGGEFDVSLQRNGLTRIVLKEGCTTAIKEAEVEIDRPTIIRVQVPHRVVNNPSSPVPRISMSIFTDKDPVFMLE